METFKMTKGFNTKLNQAFRKMLKIEGAWDSFDTAYEVMNQYKTFRDAPIFVQDFVIDVLNDYDNGFEGKEGETYEIVRDSENVIIEIIEITEITEITEEITEDTSLSHFKMYSMELNNTRGDNMNVSKKFKGLIDLKSASVKYGKGESTLKHRIQKGAFRIGIDVVKFGNCWVFDENSLIREYGKVE